MSSPYRTAEDYAHAGALRLREYTEAAAHRSAENAVTNMTTAIARGLRASVAATPDLFTPYDFSVDEAAAVLAVWILARPRR
jgi:hypothetical protein